MHPDRCALVRRGRQGLLPHGGGGGGIDQVGGGVDGGARRLVVLVQRTGTVPRGGGALGRARLEPFDEVGDVAGEGHRVVEARQRGTLAGDPAVHGPRERVLVVRFAHRDRLGHDHREVRRQARQPRGLAPDLSGRPADARQAHDQLLSEAPDAVVRAPRLDHGQREVDQVRHLGREQAADERLVQVDLVLVHAPRHRGSLPAAAARSTEFRWG